MEILFYYETKEYGFCSNFSAHAIVVRDELFATSEHYYQAAKFDALDDVSLEIRRQIREAPTPMAAKKIAQRRKRRRRTDWDTVKDDIMREAVRSKFSQHTEIRESLINTYPASLVEDTHGDFYWGRGQDGSGKNMLGRILMELRESLLLEMSVRGQFDSKCGH